MCWTAVDDRSQQPYTNRPGSLNKPSLYQHCVLDCSRRQIAAAIHKQTWITKQTITVSTLCLKNEPTLASCSFVKHGLILIILERQHQHTFKNYMQIQLSLSLHFCLLYLLLNSCDGKMTQNMTHFPR